MGAVFCITESQKITDSSIVDDLYAMWAALIIADRRAAQSYVQ